MYEVNVHGTKSVMRAALRSGVPRVVHTSTIGTIGQPEDGSLATEATPFNLWDTASHYAKSKYLAEVVVLNMCAQGLPAVVVNPCAPVGPRDIKPSSTGQRLLDYLHGRQPSFVPGGINFVSVDDVAEGHVLAAEKGRIGERYILGHRDGNLSLAAFLALMERVSGTTPGPGPRGQRSSYLGTKRTFSHGARRVLSLLRRDEPDRARRNGAAQGFRPLALTCDPSKAVSELGLPQTPLDNAFAEAVAWFKENGYVHVSGDE
jgi:dihydroflavonol-4-reductase